MSSLYNTHCVRWREPCSWSDKIWTTRDPSFCKDVPRREESFKSQSLEGEVWTGICRGVWMEIKAPPHPSRTRHFSLTKPESRAARLVTCSFVACIYHADMYIMLGQLFKGWQKIYFLTFSCSEILTSNCVLYFHVYRMKNSLTNKLLNVGHLNPFRVSLVLYTMKLDNKN